MKSPDEKKLHKIGYLRPDGTLAPLRSNPGKASRLRYGVVFNGIIYIRDTYEEAKAAANVASNIENQRIREPANLPN